mmetsp:Transcript_34146/g.47329  ORF Transcript_34146/g.47329 Transcript_34146/m.47329 type:complete len:188 (+) Transcript_34146:1-564(+)
MNLVAMGCHCFASRTTELWEELYVCDWAFTSCSCLCGGAALLADIALLDDTSSNAHGVILGLCVLIIFAAVQLRTSDIWLCQFVYEQLYLGGVFLASVAGSVRMSHLICFQTSIAKLKWLGIGAVCILVSTNLIWWDAWLCLNVGNTYAQFGFLPGFFFLFNIVHLALYKYSCSQFLGYEKLMKKQN